MSSLFNLHPEPELIYDTNQRSMFLFGGINGIKTKVPFLEVNTIASSIKDVIEEISPLVDDAYRTELASYAIDNSITTIIEPGKKRLRNSPPTKPDWKLEDSKRDFFQLEKILLEQFLEGRHTSFGFKPKYQQLLFLHILQRDSYKLPEFLGQLELKLFELYTKKAKVHYSATKKQTLVTLIATKDKEKLSSNDFLFL